MSAHKKPCGTRAAWRRHRENGETPCDPCAAAQAEYNRTRPSLPSHPCTECGQKTKAVGGVCMACQMKESAEVLDPADGQWVVRRGIRVWVPWPEPPKPVLVCRVCGVAKGETCLDLRGRPDKRGGHKKGWIEWLEEAA